MSSKSAWRARALLFDIGGIVYPVDFGAAFGEWARLAGTDRDALRRRFRFDAAYRQHERGVITVTEYFDELRVSLGIDLPHAAMLQGWNAIFRPEFGGARELLRRASRRMPIYAFSNSNYAHWEHWAVKYSATLAQFRRVFVSCEIGARKPDVSAFRRVATLMGMPADEVLFYDDTHENVLGARRAGMRAERVVEFSDLRRSLHHYL